MNRGYVEGGIEYMATSLAFLAVPVFQQKVKLGHISLGDAPDVDMDLALGRFREICAENGVGEEAIHVVIDHDASREKSRKAGSAVLVFTGFDGPPSDPGIA
jgi:hypothetical protein